MDADNNGLLLITKQCTKCVSTQHIFNKPTLKRGWLSGWCIFSASERHVRDNAAVGELFKAISPMWHTKWWKRPQRERQWGEQQWEWWEKKMKPPENNILHPYLTASAFLHVCVCACFVEPAGSRACDKHTYTSCSRYGSVMYSTLPFQAKARFGWFELSSPGTAGSLLWQKWLRTKSVIQSSTTNKQNHFERGRSEKV